MLYNLGENRVMFKARIIFNQLPLVCAVSAFAAFGFAPTVSSAATVVVTPSSMGNWAFDNRDVNGTVSLLPLGSIVTGPATPPLGTGSANLVDRKRHHRR